MSSKVKQLQGFIARGGEVPAIDPFHLGIIGLSPKDPDYVAGVDLPLTDDNWFARCTRVDEPLDQAFVEDVAANGVREAVDVFRDGDRLCLLEGRRRVRAARRAWKLDEATGKERMGVRVLIRSGAADELFRFNVGSDGPELRKNRNPIQRAELMAHYHQRVHEDLDKTARMFTCSVAQVRNYLRLLDLAASVQAEVARGALSMSNALRVVELPRAEQVAIVADYKSSVKESQSAIAEHVIDGENDKEERGTGRAPKAREEQQPRKRIAVPDTIRARRDILKMREALSELELPKDLQDACNHVVAALSWASNNRSGNSDVTKVLHLAEKAMEKPKRRA